ncbi:MAG: DUF1854 domain-containing protein [Candidatus Latescibacteria bacterium]|jgi:hypothetical protein|nr:DUF1854 domain-containing protein [Candidatus Latescibacterota bacterium]
MTDTLERRNQIFLNPEDLKLDRGDHGFPYLSEADKLWGPVRVYRAFPLSDENKFISFFDLEETYIGMVETLNGLEEKTRTILEEELSWRYFTPQITRLDRAENSAGRTLIEGMTDRGAVSISFNGIREHIVEVSPDRFIISDAHGNRFEIKDLQNLDRRSRGFIRRMI